MRCRQEHGSRKNKKKQIRRGLDWEMFDATAAALPLRTLHRTAIVDAALGWGGFIFGVSGSERFNLNSIWGSPGRNYR